MGYPDAADSLGLASLVVKACRKASLHIDHDQSDQIHPSKPASHIAGFLLRTEGRCVGSFASLIFRFAYVWKASDSPLRLITGLDYDIYDVLCGSFKQTRADEVKSVDRRP